MIIVPLHLNRTKSCKIVLRVMCIMTLIYLSTFNKGFAQRPAQPTPLDLAVRAIDNYDQTDNVDTLRWALTSLRALAYESGFPLDYSYLIAEVEVKEKVHQLKSSKADTALSRQAKSIIWDLWKYITRMEESPDPNISSPGGVKIALQRGVITIIESAKFLDHPNSLAPLIKNIINRAKKYNFVSTTIGRWAGFSELELTRAHDFLGIDYPNAMFLSNIMKADELIFVYDKSKNIINKTEDSLQRAEVSRFAVTSAETTQNPRGECFAYYLAALGKEKEDAETTIVYYDEAVDRFDKFEDVQDTNAAYLSDYFKRSNIIFDYTEFLYAYGKKLEEEGNYLRYATLLENASKIKGLVSLDKCMITKKLQEVYSELIDRLRQQGKDELAESYQKNLDRIYIYNNSNCFKTSERR
jgi:hypothetical protein